MLNSMDEHTKEVLRIIVRELRMQRQSLDVMITTLLLLLGPDDPPPGDVVPLFDVHGSEPA
jgi:hypothetical protein